VEKDGILCQQAEVLLQEKETVALLFCAAEINSFMSVAAGNCFDKGAARRFTS
jgi:hypothetical protein